MPRRRSWDDRWNRYPESRPIPTEDGIATTKRRGPMADTWWSRRFTDVLESYGLGTRMQRGRRYARAGQVLSIDVTPGLLVAQIQGSRRTPYLASVRADPVPEAAWERVEAAMQSRVGFAARLLAGEVPAELEDACTEAGIDLFPERWSTLHASCNCPDWENPCKHLAAVLYVFADQLDGAPWLLLTWRGRTRDQLLAHLDALSPTARTDGLPVWWPLVPGATDLDHLRWRSPAPSPPAVPHAVLSRLQPLSATFADRPITDAIALAYPALITPPAD